MIFNLKQTAVKKLPMALALGMAITFTQFSGAAYAEDENVIAKVGDETITKDDFKRASDGMIAQFQQVPEDQRQALMLSTYIDVRILAQKAKALKLDQSESFKKQLNFLKEQLLQREYFEKEIASKVTDESLMEAYKAQVAEQPAQEEVHARHILVKTEDEAKAIIKDLEGGADFIALAKEKSTGPSGKEGGDLGFFGKGQMIPEFETVAFALEKGMFTKTPVKSQYGYHVIKLEDRRPVEPPKFEALQPQLYQARVRDLYNETLAGIKKEVTVEILDPAFQPKKADEKMDAEKMDAEKKAK